MQTIISIIVFIVVLSVIIVIHELGHFVAAKSFGVYCSEFSLGMGPKIFGKKMGETEYQIRLLPIGGYVAMAGEVDQDEKGNMADVPYERTLKGIKTWKKCIVMLAGIFMNFVLAIVLLVGVFSVQKVGTNTSIIGKVVENHPAEQAGLQAGDKIESFYVNNKKYTVDSYQDIQNTLQTISQDKRNETVDIMVTFSRNNKPMKTNVHAKYNLDTQLYTMGIMEETRGLHFGEAIQYSINYFTTMAGLIFVTLAKILSESSKTLRQLSGPIGVFQVTSQITQTGNIANILLLTAGLSINLGIFNLLPIPGLDGSQVLFALIERAIGKDIPVKIKYVIQLAGLALVFGLMIFVTINDVTKLFH